MADNRWQDIATAPKDGTEILGWDGRQVLVSWDADFKRFEDRGGFARRVTLWMPLPDPPSEVPDGR